MQTGRKSEITGERQKYNLRERDGVIVKAREISEMVLLWVSNCATANYNYESLVKYNKFSKLLLRPSPELAMYM